jgi:hypothetical protein
VTYPLRPAVPYRARPVLVVGVVAAGTAGAMAAVVPLDRHVLAAFLLVVQIGFVTAWAYLLDTPGVIGAVAISAGAAAASDGVALSADSVPLQDFAVIVAFAFLLSLGWQIARPNRTRVTESLAATLAAVVLAVSGGAYLTLRQAGGGQPVAAALIGVAAVLGVGRLVDAFVPLPALPGIRRRGYAGLAAGLVAAAGLSAWYGASVALHPPKGDGLFYATGLHLTAGKAALIALAAAGVAAVTDLAIEAGLGTLRADPPRRRAPWPARLVVVTALPILLAAPPAYVVAKAVLT